MTYEEKLQKVIGKLKDKRELTRKGRKTQVTFDNKSFTKVRINDICKILLKLRDDERVVSLVTAFQPIRSDPTKFEQCNNDDDDFERVVEIIVEVDEVFDRWYENHLLHQKSKPQTPYLPSLLLEKLQGIYDRAIGTQSSKVFFLSVYEYIEAFENADDLTHVWKAILEMGKIENKPLNELEAKSYEEMRVVCRKIQKYVDKNKVVRPGVLSSLKEYQSLEDGNMTSSNGPLRARADKIGYALMLLAEDKTADNLDFCREYGTVKDGGGVVEWHFSPSFNKWEEDRKRMDRLQKTKIWYSWDKLVHFYTVYKDYEKMQAERINSTKIFDIWNLKVLFDEITYVMSEKKEPNKHIYEYIHADYVLYLQRLHQYTKDKLMTVREELEQKKNIQISIEERPKKESNAVNSVTQKNNKEILSCGKLHLDLEKGTLCFGGKPPVEISPDNQIIRLLILLMRYRRIVGYVEIANILDMNCWHENVENKDVAREVQYLKRDLKNYLRDKVGMSNLNIRNMLISKKNVGYKLHC